MSVIATDKTHEEPLGILLGLVENGKIEVTTISISSITQQYLDRINTIETRNAEDLSEFLQLGSRLMYIKSLALLPQLDSSEQTDELQKLNFELEEYRKYQNAAKLLAQESTRRTWHRTETTKLDISELPIPNIELKKLHEAFRRAMLRAEPIISTRNIPSHTTQKDITKNILNKLHAGSYTLDSLLDSTILRIDIIVTFLAILELIKSHKIIVKQSNQFNSIMIEKYHA